MICYIKKRDRWGYATLAPVSGSVIGATRATRTIMVGREREDYQSGS